MASVVDAINKDFKKAQMFFRSPPCAAHISTDPNDISAKVISSPLSSAPPYWSMIHVKLHNWEISLTSSEGCSLCIITQFPQH